jgi:copper(I)-binding protein
MRRAATALLSIAAINGCAANFDAQTNQIYQPADGANNKESDVYVMGTLVVADGAGHGVVVARLINSAEQPDSLVSVAATDGEGNPITVNPMPEPLELQPAESLQLAESAHIQLSGDNLQVGGVVTLDVTFDQAEPVTLEAPVVLDDGDYADVTIPAADPSAEPTETEPTG